MAAALLLLWAAPAAAQVGDTIPRPPADTAAADTTAALTGTDEPFPLRPLVEIAEPVETGFWTGIFEWERDDLLRSRAFDLADLLDEIPGITLIRSGFLVLPQAASSFGTGGGRLEIVLDGYELDPLSAASVDLSRIEIVGIQRLRVRRGLDVLRIEIESATPPDPEPYTRIDAGAGEFDTQLFRAVYHSPSFLGGRFGAGVSRLATDGIAGVQPASTFDTWARWGFVSEAGTRGFTAEFRRQSLEREARSPFPREGTRTDWVVRARSEFVPGFVAEGYLGNSRIDDEVLQEADPAIEGDSARFVGVEEEAMQAGIRAFYERDGLWARSVLRVRGAEGLPGTEAELAAGGRVAGSVSVSGEARLGSWEGEQAASTLLRLGWAPTPLLRPFAEFSTGTQGVPFLVSAEGDARLTERTALRAGIQAAWRGVEVVAAGMTLEADSVASFGLDFDDPVGLFAGGDLRGYEIGGRARLGWDPLSVEGWVINWFDNPVIYQPKQSWNGALVYHHFPLESSNLELYARLDAKHRGAMLVPIASEEAPMSLVPEITTFDFYLQIRIVDVRAFLRWENMANEQDLMDLPGLPLAPARVLYGVKWEFRN